MQIRYTFSCKNVHPKYLQSHVSTDQQSFHEFVRVLKTQTNLVQTAENLQMDYCKLYFIQEFVLCVLF